MSSRERERLEWKNKTPTLVWGEKPQASVKHYGSHVYFKKINLKTETSLFLHVPKNTKALDANAGFVNTGRPQGYCELFGIEYTCCFLTQFRLLAIICLLHAIRFLVIRRNNLAAELRVS